MTLPAEEPDWASPLPEDLATPLSGLRAAFLRALSAYRARGWMIVSTPAAEAFQPHAPDVVLPTGPSLVGPFTRPVLFVLDSRTPRSAVDDVLCPSRNVLTYWPTVTLSPS